ncbi:hypothetical protein GOP47_0005613 [Adiantum capillus-veneris]|uniref:Uncharacterized protein n=1 Tax=Adiantum capillus-veneris TaxID=13818 RepID=A0A9D4V5V9_ADICA|nr:hypothetical protein GOP47_0005613 [Adiantum capillus-veneris]
MLVDGIHNNTIGNLKVVLEWNHFSTALASGVMEIADVHLADEGFLVTLSLAQILGDLAMQANRVSLQLHGSWTLMCDGGYLHPETGEQVRLPSLCEACA